VKPPPFEYCRAADEEEALAILSEDASAGIDTKVLAGGQSLIPLLNFRLSAPERLLDISQLPLGGIEVARDGSLRIGAMARQLQVERDERVRAGWPVLARATSLVGHPQVRARGTVCGSLAHHDPASELPAVAVALGAVVELASVGGRRLVPAADFFVSHFVTDRTDEELVVAVTFPAPERGERAAFLELSVRHGDFALVGVCARLVVGDDGSLQRLRLVFSGCGSKPVMVEHPDLVAGGGSVDDTLLAGLDELIVEILDPPDDVSASGTYRKETAVVLARRAISEAMGAAA
jgi:carbon-monoxide dehydrogenase medium subunit